MVVRLVQTHVDPDRVREYASVYAEKIFPVLGQTEGCLYAALVVNARQRDRAVSVSLWESEEDADSYEKSGRYDELVNVLRPYFSDSMNWQLRLSVDMRLEHVPAEAEPVVRAYVGADEHGSVTPMSRTSGGFLRIVSMVVRPGQVETFSRLYRERVLTALRKEPGCCSVQLAESIADPRDFISFTIWETRDAAERYESSGQFESLRLVLQPTLSSLYQWKLQQEGGAGRRITTSEDVTVDGFEVLASRSFGKFIAG